MRCLSPPSLRKGTKDHQSHEPGRAEVYVYAAFRDPNIESSVLVFASSRV